MVRHFILRDWSGRVTVARSLAAVQMRARGRVHMCMHVFSPCVSLMAWLVLCWCWRWCRLISRGTVRWHHRLCERCQAHAKKPTLTRQLSQSSPKRGPGNGGRRPDFRKVREKAALEGGPLFAPPNRHLQQQHDAEEAATATALSGVSPAVPAPAAAQAAAGGSEDSKPGSEPAATDGKKGKKGSKGKAKGKVKGEGLTISPVVPADDEEEHQAEEDASATAAGLARSNAQKSPLLKPSGSPHANAWTAEEDEQLAALVEESGAGEWTAKARAFDTSRGAAALRLRWSVISPEARTAATTDTAAGKASASSASASSGRGAGGGGGSAGRQPQRSPIGMSPRLTDKGSAAAAAHQAAEAAVRSTAHPFCL